VIRDDLAEQGLTWVGRPLEVVRILDSVYLDQARNDFLGYVRGTLAVSQSLGGRFNPPGEFGALYTAGDEATAWEEVAARYRRQGFRNLPADMGLIGILITVGRFADLADDPTRRLWEISETALSSSDPSPEERDSCWAVSRAVRAVADFLQSPSARADGINIPLYPDRENGDLRMEMQFAVRREVPAPLRQEARESW
jgi:RES domain-containing protein